jgi:hypothetical protein
MNRWRPNLELRTVKRALEFLVVIVVLSHPVSNYAQQPANTTPAAPSNSTTNPLGRKSPPQPQQKQSLDYFVGTWNVTWSGRESAFSPGPRTGTLTFTRLGSSNFLGMRGEGKSDAGAYKESGTLGWHEGQKIVVMREQLANGVDVLSIGDWTSPIAIRFESAPVTVQGQTLTLRRTFGIVSAQSFTITDEMSTDGKVFTRIGNAVVGKSKP